VRRGLLPAVSLLLALAAGIAHAQAPPPDRRTTWLQRRLETGLAEALGGTVRIGRMDVDWTSLAATVGDVSISIPAGDAAPLTVTMAEGHIKLAWSGLTGLAGGDIHISEVVARQATFSLSREWIDALKPRKTKTDRGAVAIQIDRLVIDDAAAEYSDGHQHLRIATRSMDFRGDWSTSRRLLVGEVQADVTVEAPLFDRPWPAKVRGGLRLGGGRLEIFGATGSGPGASAELSGNVTWSAGASFTAEARADVDLAQLSPYLVGELPLSGRVEGPLQIVYTLGVPIRVTMQAATTALRIGPIVTETARAEVTVRPGHLEVAALDARGYGGAFTGTVALGFAHPLHLETNLVGKGADLARLIALAGKDLPIASVADVTFAIAGEPGRVVTWTGGGTFDASPGPPGPSGRIPARGRGRLTFETGRVRVAAEPLSMAEAALRFELAADLSAQPPGVRVAIAGSTKDARATQRAALKLMDALGVARNRFAVEPLSGAGTVAAAIETGAANTLSLDLDLTAGSYSGEPFASALFSLASDESSVAIRHLDLKSADASASGSARFDARGGALDEIDLTVRNAPIAHLLTQAGIVAPIDGRLDGTLKGYRDADGFAAAGQVTARNVIVGHEIIDVVEGPVRIEGDRVVLDGLVARAHGLDARGRLLYDLPKGEAQIELESARVDLAANRTLAEAQLVVSGTIDTKGTITVDRSGPSGLLRLVCTDLLVDTGRSGLRELRLGNLQGTAAISPRGTELSVRSMPDASWTFDAFLGFAPSLPLSAVLYFEDLVAGAGGVFGESVDLRLKGQVQAEGDLTAPRAMEINGAFDEVAVRLGPHVLKAVEPFPLRLDNGRFVLGPSRFEGDAAHVALSGSGSIEGGDIEGYLRGNADLAVVSAIWSEIRGGGPVEIDATLGGTMTRPDLRGRVTVKDGRLRLIGYPQSLESIDAEARFEGQTLKLVSFRALQGGGEIQASGEVAFKGVVPSSYNAMFRGANVVAKFPEGFKGTYEGQLAIDGTPKRATISGRIEVVRGLYARDFDVGLFGGAHREFDAASESPFPRNIFLDVDIVAPGNVFLRNDVAKVEATGQLHIGGELARPEVTGRFSLVPGGTVRYRDVDYRIDYGTADLTDPKRINPYVDFRGHTRVSSYEISLHVEGTVDKFDYELTSTPPLASQDIISLLVTGKTLDSLSGTASAAALPGDMAAYYFAGLLSSTFGKQIQNSLGIDQLEITPLLLKGESDPNARVTVGKQVSDTVKIVFSQDIGTAQKQTYQVAWDASRRIRLVAESDTEAGLGGELQYADRFGGTPFDLRATPLSGVAAVGDEPRAVASVDVSSDDGRPRTDLIKTAKIKKGAPFDRGRMLQGADRIRAALVKDGFIQANVRADAAFEDGPPAGYRITYRVAPGPRVKVEIVMAGGKGKRSMKKALKAFWRETPYTQDFWDEATHALLEQLQSNGYYAADITWHAIDTGDARAVRIDVDRGKPVRLRALRFAGTVSIPKERIDKQLASLKSQGFRKRLLRPAVLFADLAAVRALYRDEGYTRVRIGAPRVALAATGDSAEVDVLVEEGPRYSVGDVAFVNEDAPAATEAELRALTPLSTGQTFSPRRLAESEQTLKDQLDLRGYPDANVESRVQLASESADVTFDVTAGDRKTVGEIAIEGNRVTKERTIARALTFGRGDLVSKRSLLSSQQQLYRSGLFSNVKLTVTPLGGEDPTAQKITVRVDEAPPFALGLGVGYDSEDGPRASFLLGYANLGGRNVGITLQGRFSGKENQGVLSVRRRRVFGNTIDALGTVLFARTVESSFTESRRTLSVRLEQSPKPRWVRFLRYTVQQVGISDISDVQAALEQKFDDKLSFIRLADVGVGLVRDTRDDAFQATRGGYGSIEGSVFARPLGSEASFLKLFVRGSWTVSLKRGTRFATFLRVGAQYPFADSSIVPLSERFFAGGSNTLRGFATDSVAGLQVAGFNAGGEALLVLNEEWNFPIWRTLRGELFLDAGNVYPTIGDFDPTDLRSSAGVGLRLETPIGPIRIEYGWKLDRRPDESSGELVFAIGTVF